MKPVIGVVIPLRTLLEKGVSHVTELGLTGCQITCWDEAELTAENARQVRSMGEQIAITSMSAGWPGPKVWDFIQGPATLGLVPAAYRARRMEALVRAADFARLAGITDVMTHVGFIPENPATGEYTELLAAVTWVAKAFQERGIHFNFETGQETPITLMRTIWDMDLPNVGVNLDPANLLLYGKANPVDAVSIYGRAIRGLHVKDGCYPTDGRHLGREMPVGEGNVHFDRLIPALQAQGFTGPYIIEREIEGDQQRRDIIKARQVLERYL